MTCYIFLIVILLLGYSEDLFLTDAYNRLITCMFQFLLLFILLL